MNSRTKTNSQLSTTEPENTKQNKLSKRLEQEQNHRNGDHMEGYRQGGGLEENGEKHTENKKHNW